jgi:hypothetical protein
VCEDTRLSASQLSNLTERIRRILETWDLHDSDLAICEGTTQADIIFAEECLAKNSRVRLMILEPEPRGAATWPFEDPEWLRRFHELTRQDSVEVWFHDKHLGSAILAVSSETDDDEIIPKRRRAIRHKLWIINTERIEAEQVNDVYKPSESRKGRLFGLFVLNGRHAEGRPENPGYFKRFVNEFDGYRGEIEVIRPDTATLPKSASA